MVASLIFSPFFMMDLELPLLMKLKGLEMEAQLEQRLQDLHSKE